MSDLGFLSLVISLILVIYGGVVSVVGARRGHAALVDSGRRSFYAAAAFMTLGIAILFHALVTHDFTLKYVADHSNRALPAPYAFASLWSGQGGSLLFWGWILALYGTAALFLNRDRNRDIMPYVTAVVAANLAFFLFIVIFIANPFEKLPNVNVPADGRGLNPLLQHPAMLIHPPCLYLGYVGMAIPFAFAMAALFSGNLGDAWIRTTRRWVLLPWFFLGIGILLGGRWAYVELGWGGYWAWDPVENASLMPWLAGTAYLHSVMIQEKRNMMKFWNHFLVALTFILAVFGTFITRSGMVSSVHSFTQSEIGPYFLGYILTIIAVTAVMFWVRRRELHSQSKLDSYVSRESAFLLNNLVLLGACFAVLWGTVFPMLSEGLSGVRTAVGPPWFNRVNVPIGLLLLALTGIGPLIAWRRASAKNLRSMFKVPVFGALAAAIVLFAAGVAHFYALVSFSLSVFVSAAVLQEFWRGTRARRRQYGESFATAFRRLVDKNRRRYGGYIVHLGMVSIFVGFTGAAFNAEREATLVPGQTVEIGDYTLRYEKLETGRDANHEWANVRFKTYRGTEYVTDLVPAKHFYTASQQPTTEVAIHSTLKEDLYVAVASVDDEGMVTFKVYLNPLVQWIWIGGFIFALGTLIVMWPDPMDRRYLVPKYA